MKRREFTRKLGALGALLAVGRIGHAQDEGVHPLFVADPKNPNLKEFRIRDPGKYVLNEDIIQRKLWSIEGPRPNGGVMLILYCGSVELDFQGHTLGADYGVAGVDLSSKLNLDFAKSSPKRYGPASLDSRFVTLRNGVIDLARGEHTLTGIQFVNEWGSPAAQTVERPIKRVRQQGVVGDIEVENITYERNDYLFERLKVLTNGLSMAVEGSHTVIRNCVIESSGNAAIFIAGPNVTIESCEIRLRKSRKWGSYSNPRAAIVLRDGSNAIIRNNRIRTDYGGDGKETETHCILVRDGAKNVLIEGNTFINVKGEPVTLTESAQAIMRDNKQEEHWLPF